MRQAVRAACKAIRIPLRSMLMFCCRRIKASVNRRLREQAPDAPLPVALALLVAIQIGSAAEPAGAGDFEEIFDAAVFWVARSGMR